MTIARSSSPVRRIFLVQLGVTLGLAVVTILAGPMVAFSTLLGGLVYTLASGYAGWRLFASKENVSEHGELANMYRAEFSKLLMFGAFTTAVFTGLRDVNIGAFIGGCVAAMIAGVIGAATFREHQAPKAE